MHDRARPPFFQMQVKMHILPPTPRAITVRGRWSPSPVPKELCRRTDYPAELLRSIQQMVSQAATGLGSNAADGVGGLCDALGRRCDALGAGADQRKVQGACATLRKKCAELQAGPAPPPPPHGPGLGTPTAPPPKPAAGGLGPPPPSPPLQGQGLGPAPGVPDGAGLDNTNRLSAATRMGRDMALGVGVVVLVGLFTV